MTDFDDGPLAGWVICDEPGCPSWDDTATDEACDEFDDTEWAHGQRHHFIGDEWWAPER